MFITGPDVVKTVTGEEVTFEELGGAATHASKSGVAHFVAARRGGVPRRRALPALVPAAERTASRRRTTAPPTRSTGSRAELDTLIPDNPNKPYDMKRGRSSASSTTAQFLEVQPRYAENIVCGFARLGGHAGRRRRQPAARARRRARHRLVDEGGALRPHLRRVQHSARDLRRRARLPARAPRRNGAASSGTARSCCTPTPRRPCRSSP